MPDRHPSAQPAGSPTLAPARPDPVHADGDHERMAHIVLEGFRLDKSDYVPAGTTVVEGIVEGTPVTALCGKVWVPGRDPTRLIPSARPARRSPPPEAGPCRAPEALRPPDHRPGSPIRPPGRPVSVCHTGDPRWA